MNYKYSNSPYRKIPTELVNDYTMGSQIPVVEIYLDGSKKKTVIWDDNMINEYIDRFTPENIKNNLEGKSSYGNAVCINLLNSFEKYQLTGKNVAVVGSETPWIEAILINLKNSVTTIDYNVPQCNYKHLRCKDYFTFFEKNENPFDAIISFSSIEHSGLGRYGDPLDPHGDIKAMNTIHKNLKKNGLLFWGAPTIGRDFLVWNAHRIYGPIRLPFIFKKYKEIEWFGKTKQQIFNIPIINKNDPGFYQPVVVLKPT